MVNANFKTRTISFLRTDGKTFVQICGLHCEKKVQGGSGPYTLDSLEHVSL